MVKSLSVAEKYPDSLKYWDYKKNDCTPQEVSHGTCKKYYWLCNKGHSTYATPKDKGNYNFPCAICSGRKLLVGYNDLWTTHPHISKLLENPEEGYKITYGSRKRFNWICPTCGNIIKNKEVNNITSRGVICNLCGDGISYPEKLFSSLLKELKINYIYQLSNTYQNFEWCNKYRYDFYLPDTNSIIEINGGFHYDYEYKYSNAKTLQEVKENDILKKEVALKNGISNYISIDARESNLHYIKNSILRSPFSTLYNLTNVDWDCVERNIISNMIVEICKFYNQNPNNTIQNIAEKYKLHYDTVSRYLNKGSSLGFCIYDSKSHQLKMQRQNHYSHPVICITTNKFFSSLKEAGVFYNISPANISSCCSGKNKTCGKLPNGIRLKWKYA